MLYVTSFMFMSKFFSWTKTRTEYTNKVGMIQAKMQSPNPFLHLNNFLLHILKSWTWGQHPWNVEWHLFTCVNCQIFFSTKCNFLHLVLKIFNDSLHDFIWLSVFCLFVCFNHSLAPWITAAHSPLTQNKTINLQTSKPLYCIKNIVHLCA